MQSESRRSPLNWRKLQRSILLLCGLNALLMSSACCKAHVEVKYIEIKPKVRRLPAEISQAMQPNSTELLKRAEDWSKSSQKLLDSVTDK